MLGFALFTCVWMVYGDFVLAEYMNMLLLGYELTERTPDASILRG